VRRVARTVADLDGAPALVTDEHVSLALGLRADLVATEVAA
jgi:predicted ATPase with chaperone activity